MSFDESKHPRDAEGKFTDGAEESSAARLKRIEEKYFPHLRPRLQKSPILTNKADNDTIKLPDIYIGRSVGAKAKNYQVLDLETGKHYSFAENTYLQNVEVFAGKGTKKTFRRAEKYANLYGGRAQDWQHVKAIGIVETSKGQAKAEVHWSQCQGIGKIDFFIKRWLE